MPALMLYGQPFRRRGNARTNGIYMRKCNITGDNERKENVQATRAKLCLGESVGPGNKESKHQGY